MFGKKKDKSKSTKEKTKKEKIKDQKKRVEKPVVKVQDETTELPVYLPSVYPKRNLYGWTENTVPQDQTYYSRQGSHVTSPLVNNENTRSTNVDFTGGDTPHGSYHNSVVDVTNTLLYQKKAKAAEAIGKPITGAILRDSRGATVAVQNSTISDSLYGYNRANLDLPNNGYGIRTPGDPPGHGTSVVTSGIPGQGYGVQHAMSSQPVSYAGVQPHGTIARMYSDPSYTSHNSDEAFKAHDRTPVNGGNEHLTQPRNYTVSAQANYGPFVGKPTENAPPKLKGILKNGPIKKVEFDDIPKVALVSNLTKHVSVESLWYPDPYVEHAKAQQQQQAGVWRRPFMDDTYVHSFNRRRVNSYPIPMDYRSYRKRPSYEKYVLDYSGLSGPPGYPDMRYNSPTVYAVRQRPNIIIGRIAKDFY